MKEIILANEQATLALGKTIAKQLQAGQLLFLSGDLGSGKTTLVRGLLQALGYQGMVKSPTYTLVESYDVNGQHICHFDLYRLEQAEELEMIGIRDYLSNDNICLVEWPERALALLPTADIYCHLSIVDDHRIANLS